jgi:hypothetical protein
MMTARMNGWMMVMVIVALVVLAAGAQACETCGRPGEVHVALATSSGSPAATALVTAPELGTFVGPVARTESEAIILRVRDDGRLALLTLRPLVQVSGQTLCVFAETDATGTTKLGPIIIPDDLIEPSIITGTAFPDGILAGGLSFKVVQTATGRGMGYLDLGLTLDAGEVGGILGASYKFATWGDLKMAAGGGVWIPRFTLSRAVPVVYTRMLAW